MNRSTPPPTAADHDTTPLPTLVQAKTRDFILRKRTNDLRKRVRNLQTRWIMLRRQYNASERFGALYQHEDPSTAAGELERLLTDRLAQLRGQMEVVYGLVREALLILGSKTAKYIGLLRRWRESFGSEWEPIERDAVAIERWATHSLEYMAYALRDVKDYSAEEIIWDAPYEVPPIVEDEVSYMWETTTGSDGGLGGRP